MTIVCRLAANLKGNSAVFCLLVWYWNLSYCRCSLSFFIFPTVSTFFLFFFLKYLNSDAVMTIQDIEQLISEHHITPDDRDQWGATLECCGYLLKSSHSGGYNNNNSISLTCIERIILWLSPVFLQSWINVHLFICGARKITWKVGFSVVIGLRFPRKHNETTCLIETSWRAEKLLHGDNGGSLIGLLWLLECRLSNTKNLTDVSSSSVWTIFEKVTFLRSTSFCQTTTIIELLSISEQQ